MVTGVRRMGGRGPGTRGRGRAGGVPLSRSRNALRAPDRGALHATVHHTPRSQGSPATERPADRRLLDGTVQTVDPGRLSPAPVSRVPSGGVAGDPRPCVPGPVRRGRGGLLPLFPQ